MNENPYSHVRRGVRIYRNTGELSFETRPRSAGTFECTFLEVVDATHCKIVNTRGRLEVVHNSLLSAFKI